MGEICPVPSIKVQTFLKNLKVGEEITVLVDHSCAVGNIIETLDKLSCLHTVNEVANGIWEVHIKKR